MKEFKYNLHHKASKCAEGHSDHLVYGDSVMTVIALNEDDAIRRARADIPRELYKCFNAIEVKIISVTNEPTN